MNKIKTLGIVAATATLSLGGLTSNAFAADSWGPQDRETFTWESPASYATFNSITDNPSLGDERNFVRVCEVEDGEEYDAEAKLSKCDDELELEVGKEYKVYIYYHNNGAANLGSKVMATGVKVASQMPSTLQAGETAQVKGTITASNTTPTSVWDTAYLTAKETTYLRYVTNSAVLHNSGTANGTVLDGDALLSDGGVAIAYSDSYWGVIPGCNEYAGYVTYRVKADAPDLTVIKEASLDGENWSQEVSAKPGDIVYFRITVKNTGTTTQKDVTFHDEFPDGLEYVNGSGYVTTTADTDGATTTDVLFTDGVGIGKLLAGEEAIFTYKAQISESTDLFDCGDSTVVNKAYVATTSGKEESSSTITITRTCDCNENPNQDGCNITPTELPKTGPAEMAVALVIMLLIGLGAGYWFSSLVRLRKATNSAKGTQSKKTVKQSDSDIVKDGIVDKK